MLRRERIEVIEAPARLAGPGQLDVAGSGLHYRRLVIATGSVPAIPPIQGIDRVGALTNETIFDLTTQPAALLIIGGGPIGVELGPSPASAPP